MVWLVNPSNPLREKGEFDPFLSRNCFQFGTCTYWNTLEHTIYCISIPKRTMSCKSVAVKPAVIKPKRYLVSIAIIGVLFFVFGFVIRINAILIPYFKSHHLSNFDSYLVAFAFYISYLVMSVLLFLTCLKLSVFKRGWCLAFFIMAVVHTSFIPRQWVEPMKCFYLDFSPLGTGLAVPSRPLLNPICDYFGPKDKPFADQVVNGIFNKGAGNSGFPSYLQAVVLRVGVLNFQSAGTMESSRKCRIGWAD